MPKIMEIIEKETKGKSYHTYKYSYDSIGLPSIDYDDDPNKIMKWKDSGETGSPKKSINLKPLADQLQEVGEKPLLKYFLDGSRHVFKVDDIAYNKQVFPVVARQIGKRFNPQKSFKVPSLFFHFFGMDFCDSLSSVANAFAFSSVVMSR